MKRLQVNNSLGFRLFISFIHTIRNNNRSKECISLLHLPAESTASGAILMVSFHTHICHLFRLAMHRWLVMGLEVWRGRDQLPGRTLGHFAHSRFVELGC